MLVTVVTVCYNEVKSIEQTIQSVLGQTYKNIEYIVIDGLSTDGTYEILCKYAQKILLIHERDEGIYNAMNKGISFAKGEYIYFLNSGDVFSSADVLEKVVKRLEEKRPDILCANVNYIFENGRKILHNYVARRQLSRFWMGVGITVCHQGIFARTDIMKQKKFDEKYKIWADQEFLAYCLNRRYSIQYLNCVICNFDAYGFSSGKDKKGISRIECDSINRKYNRFFYYVFRGPKFLVRVIWS